MTVHIRITSIVAWFAVVTTLIIIRISYNIPDEAIREWPILQIYATCLVAALILVAVIADIAHSDTSNWTGILLLTSWSTSVILQFTRIYSAFGVESAAGSLDRSVTTAHYFSIVTWTILGYGDFHPIEKLRLFASFEALLGYAAMAVIAGIVVVIITKKMIKS